MLQGNDSLLDATCKAQVLALLAAKPFCFKGSLACSLSRLWDTIKEDFNRQGFFQSGSLPGDKQRQKGVVRVNCIDCLDRTNVVQGLLGRKHLEYVLDRAGLLDVTDILALPNTFPQVCLLLANS